MFREFRGGGGGGGGRFFFDFFGALYTRFLLLSKHFPVLPTVSLQHNAPTDEFSAF